MKKLRESTPKSLIKIIKDFDYQLKECDLSKKNRKKIEHFKNNFEKLASHQNMDTVWKRIKQRKDHEWTDTWVITEIGIEPVYDDCLDYAIKIVDFIERSPWESLSKTERVNKAKDIKKRMKKLAIEIEKYQLGVNALDYIDKEDFEGIYKLDFSITHEERCINYFNFPVSVSKIMEKCADEITEKVYSPNLIAQPSRENADFIVFARKLMNWNKKIYGSPLYGITVKVTEIFFPDVEISENRVRNLFTR